MPGLDPDVGAGTLPYWLLLANGFVTGMLLFTLYPLTVALANDHVEQPAPGRVVGVLLTLRGRRLYRRWWPAR